MREITYWPVYHFNPHTVDYEMIAIFTSREESKAFAGEFTGELNGQHYDGYLVAPFNGIKLDDIKIKVVRYWINSVVPDFLHDGAKLTWGDKEFTIAVGRAEKQVVSNTRDAA